MFAAVAPAALLLLVILAPIVLRYGPGGTRFNRASNALRQAQAALGRVRAGLVVFRKPRLGLAATVEPALGLGASVPLVLLPAGALGLDHKAGFGAAAAVLFAVNITAVLPATPANLGVFQAACATVLHTGWHVGYGHGRRLRRDPPGRRGHDRDPAGHARAAEGGHVLA